VNYQKAIAYLKNTIEFNDLEYGSVRQLSEVIKFLEAKERADYTMEGANLHPPTTAGAQLPIGDGGPDGFLNDNG